jgi:hypothetical protein
MTERGKTKKKKKIQYEKEVFQRELGFERRGRQMFQEIERRKTGIKEEEGEGKEK